MERHSRLGDVEEVTELLQRQLDAVMFVRPLLAQMNLFSLGRSLLELWGLKAALEEVAKVRGSRQAVSNCRVYEPGGVRVRGDPCDHSGEVKWPKEE